MKDNLKFEEALIQLESAVKRLESGEDIDLDDAISVYEEAVKLVKICHTKLENAEQKIKILVEGEDGSVSDRPFNAENEN